jgi:hypothetical protein
MLAVYQKDSPNCRGPSTFTFSVNRPTVNDEIVTGCLEEIGVVVELTQTPVTEAAKQSTYALTT